MDVSILICAFGDKGWKELAYTRALPSTQGQGANECLIVYDEQATLAKVRNEAAENATHTWLLFLDADDELAPGYVDAMHAAVTSWREDALYYPKVEYLGGPRKRPAAFPNEGVAMTVANRCVIGTLIRRDTFWAMGGFQEYPIYEDWALFLKVHLSKRGMIPVSGATYLAHMKPGRSRNRPGARALATKTYAQIRRENGLLAA